MSDLKPRAPVPALNVAMTNGSSWQLAGRRPEQFTMIVFYRGLHCPICKTYIAELDAKLSEFTRRGVDVVAISGDTRERAQQSCEKWGLTQLAVGYGFPVNEARNWGLFISNAIKESEPAEFFEPGLFLIKPDGTLYASSVISMPFARPHFGDVLNAIDFVVKNGYPARGEA
ncbi:peroxiredoxin-like family protein [Paraburkholderia phymatum]|uniref:Peroxiredoxin-like family protein n=1 Tax=Paraburkholderia phymatum TaxID=148447 RepID=A0ACC6U4A7_9BURK